MNDYSDSDTEHLQAADQLADAVLVRAAAVGIAISDEVRREALAAVRRLARARKAPLELVRDILHAARQILRKYEPYLARVATDAMVAAWLEGGHGVVRRLPSALLTNDPLLRLLGDMGKPPKPPTWAATAGDPGRFARFPIIEEAAKDLAARQLLPRATFDAVGRDARLHGFTVAKVTSLDALAKVRDALADAILDGSTLKQFADRVNEAIDGSQLGPAHLETVFRTGVLREYARGQKAVVEHPLVRSALPFARRVEIRDSRLTPLCDALSHAGLQGTGIFCVDDPVWRELAAPPSHFNCRCNTVFLPLDRAASRGIKAAQLWLSTGQRPPDEVLFVPRPAIELPPGWVSGWAA